jgi:hypothetical protein
VDELPSLWTLIKLRRRMDNLFPLEIEDRSVRNQFLPKLRSILYQLHIKNKKDPLFELQDLIKIKISGDGTNIGIIF